MKTKLLLLFAVFMTAFSVNAQITSVAVVGAGVGGWPGETGNPGPVDVHQLTRVTPGGDDWIIENLVVIGPGIKIRANNAWTDAAGGGGNWGRPTSGSQWPTATADEGGGSGDINFGVIPGTYTLTFNTVTKVYNFAGGTPVPVVKLVGSAVTGGTITMVATSPTTWELPLTTFLTGTAQIEIDGVIQVGGNTFPVGDILTGTSIPVTAGAYTSVTYNNDTSAYVFTAAPLYPRIGLIGSGTTGTDAGWNQDIAMATNDGIKYQLNQQMYSINTSNNSAAKVKFRQDQNWGIPSFGGDTFTATNNLGTGGDIPVTAAGIYNVFFNLTTKVYNFVKEGSVALVGAAANGWPGDSAGNNPGPVDINQMATTDNDTFTLTGIVISEGPLLFRQDNKWDVKFGGTSFPSGPVAPGNNGDIIVGAGQAGTYNVTLVKSTGAYTFTPNLATSSFAAAGFKVYPNPTQSNWNFTSTKDAIVSVQVIDMLGKVVATSTTANVDASALNAGVYFAKVTTATATATVKVVKN
jgi:starch-binding outer membrane protein SusE/F